MDPAIALARVRFPFGNESAPVRRDGVAYAEALARTVPLADFIPSGSDAGFLSRHTLIRTGSVLVGAGSDTGNMAVIDGELALSTVFLPLLGQISFQVGNRRLEARQGQSLVFLAGEAFRSENGFYAGSCFSVPLGRLAAQAAELSGDPGSIDRFLTGCRESRQINLDTPLLCHLQASMERTLALLASLRPEGEGLNGREGEAIESLLIRFLTLLLHPQLAGDLPRDHLPRLRVPRRRRRWREDPPRSGGRPGPQDCPPEAG